MYSYSTSVCRNLRIKKKKKKNNTQIEVSCVNKLFGGAHIHLDCTPHTLYLPLPFAFTRFPFACLICFEKKHKLDRHRIEKVRLFIQNSFCIAI